MFFDYVPAWPEEIKQAQRECQRLYYKKINLENNMETADYSSFDMLYAEFERTKEALFAAVEKFNRLQWAYATQQKEKATNG